MYISIKPAIKYNIVILTVDNLNNINIVEIEKDLLKLFKNEPKNILLDFKNILHCNIDAWKIVYKLQAFFYTNNYSFILFNINATLLFANIDIELKNKLIYSPTEIEAIDLINLEDLERELLL